MRQLLLVGFDGFLGSIARYLVAKLNLTWNFHSIPMGTLTVNILGSILIGFFLGIFIKLPSKEINYMDKKATKAKTTVTIQNTDTTFVSCHPDNSKWR